MTRGYGWIYLQVGIKHESHRTFNTLRPRQNGRHFPDDIFKCIFLNENVWISISISLKFVPGGPINNMPSLVHIMAWHRPGDKPLSEPMMVNLLTHICVTLPQWVKILHTISPKKQISKHIRYIIKWHNHATGWWNLFSRYSFHVLSPTHVIWSLHCPAMTWWRHEYRLISHRSSISKVFL